MTKNSEIHHLNHSIKTMKSPSGYKARAFRGDAAVGSVFEAETKDMAVHAVKTFLNERASELHSKRGPSGFPCAEEVREAFSQVSMNKAQEAMLTAHLASPGHILTATELAQAAGYKDYSVANSQYGMLARRLAEELGYTPSETTNSVTTWTFTLAESADLKAPEEAVEPDGQWRWHLRPEVAEALSGWKPGQPHLLG